MYVKFFDGPEGRMSIDVFRYICMACDYDAECVQCKAKKRGYTYYAECVFGMALIDMIGFEYPFEVYDVRK